MRHGQEPPLRNTRILAKVRREYSANCGVDRDDRVKGYHALSDAHTNTGSQMVDAEAIQHSSDLARTQRKDHFEKSKYRV